MNKEAKETRRRDILNQLGPLRNQHQTITRDIERLEEELESMQREGGKWDAS